MKVISRRMNWPAMILLVALVGLVAYQTRANRPIAQATPTVVVTVNIEKVFGALDERAAADEQLVQMAESLKAEGEQLSDEIDRLRDELEYLEDNSPQYVQSAEEVLLKQYEFEGFQDVAQRKLGRERARILRDLYQKIRDAAAALSRQNGYDIVLVDDTVAELPRNASEAETMRQISARRMLYANPQIDVSDELTVFMNQGFANRNG